MTLGEYIKRYRCEHNLSQRAFASKCGVSNGYISMLEEGKNPKTNAPIVPNVITLKKIATSMGITLHTLISNVEDMPVSIFAEEEQKQNPPTELDLSDGEKLLIELFRKLPEESQKMYVEVLRATLKNLPKD